MFNFWVSVMWKGVGCQKNKNKKKKEGGKGEKEKKKGKKDPFPPGFLPQVVLKLHSYFGGGSNFEYGNKGQTSRPPELHTRKGSGNTPPLESCKRVDSSTPSIPTSFSKHLPPPQKHNF